MRICTVTCHNVDNYGARLQAYALARYLSEEGNEVRVIDYQPDYLNPSCRLLFWPGTSLKEWVKLIWFLPRRARKKRRARKGIAFTKRYLPLTPITYRSISDLRQNPPDADLYLAGSDQIWNTFFKNGWDPVFYLDFGPSSVRRESYAASFATNELCPGSEDFIRKNLARFHRISVRETSGLKILERLGIQGGIQQYDPVFLLSEGQWSQLADDTGVGKNYLLVYDFFSDPIIKEKAQRAAKDRKLKIYAICPLFQFYADKNYTTAGPETFVSLIKNAALVVTNSFHAIAFCQIFRREYLFVPRPDGMNGRIEELIRQGSSL